jgi:hypothetical protein
MSDTEMTPEQRRLRASAASQSRWAMEPDRRVAMEPAKRGFRARFERQVDPDGTLSPQERAVRTDMAIKAHMASLALKSSRSRQRKRKAA